MELFQIITLVLAVSSFLFPLIYGYKKRHTLLWQYLLFSFACDVLTIVVKRVFHHSPIALGNVLCFGEFIFLSLYYYRYVNSKHTVFIIIASVVALFYVSRLAIYGIDDNNGIGFSLFALTYIGYSLWGFYRLAMDKNIENIVQSSFFIVNVAVLLGFAGKFLIYFFSDYLYDHQRPALFALWIFVKLLNIAVNILFAIALSNKHDE